MIRGTVCSNVCMYGSVGALGGQPPRATRQYTLCPRQPGLPFAKMNEGALWPDKAIMGPERISPPDVPYLLRN